MQLLQCLSYKIFSTRACTWITSLIENAPVVTVERVAGAELLPPICSDADGQMHVSPQIAALKEELNKEIETNARLQTEAARRSQVRAPPADCAFMRQSTCARVKQVSAAAFSVPSHEKLAG